MRSLHSSPRTLTPASVLARAVLASLTAKPIVFIDEIDKATRGGPSGSLFNSITGFLEIETAARYRDVSPSMPNWTCRTSATSARPTTYRRCRITCATVSGSCLCLSPA